MVGGDEPGSAGQVDAVVVVAFAGWSARKESRRYSALEILRQRYARGEINKKKLQSRKRNLS